MYIKVKNENYGSATATFGDYVVIGNPAVTLYNYISSSTFYTGSIDIFRYNKNTDEHDYIYTFYKPPTETSVIITTELSGSVISTASIYTESGSISAQSNLPIEIDRNAYTSSLYDGFGMSLDMYNKFLIVGCPYYTETFSTSASYITASGDAVYVYNLELTEYASFTPTASANVYTINDPDIADSNWMSESFGQAVSINDDWIAIGSPLISSSKGIVYLFRNETTGSNYSWTLYQKLEASGSNSDAQLGFSLKLDKSGSLDTSRLIVGCGNKTNCQAYLFEIISGSWIQTYTFEPDYTVYPMTFGNYYPSESGPFNEGTNGFGNSVSIYGDSVIIGEPYDRGFHEYSGSTYYQQGSVYIFNRCPGSQYIMSVSHSLYKQMIKTYGNTSSIKNNLAGFSVDIFENNAIAGVPKINALSMDSCYIGGTLEQLYGCDFNLEDSLSGQSIFFQKDTSSLDWNITNIYQKKKKYLSPYRDYGYSVSIADKSMVIGSPMYLNDSNGEITIYHTQSNGVTLDDISGKAYIYNLKNLRDEFHIGNIFYRNGKVVIMTSGSVFDEVLFNPTTVYSYEYDLSFKSQNTIYEKQIICTVNPGEFNISTNPSSLEYNTSSLDINNNGKFDFQDVDILLRYMQYKNTSLLGVPVSTDWSSSFLSSNDEITLFNWYNDNSGYNVNDTEIKFSSSLVLWETTNTFMQTVLDLNDDNRIDSNDLNIMWKYFSNRLNQQNYSSYVTPACKRKLFSDIIDYMDFVSRRSQIPKISHDFFGYEYSSSIDKTGSYLTPVVTSIGIYSGLDLVAIAKLGNPIKIIPDLPINFSIKIDF